ncbi:MAG: cytochrome C oxidase Cbb3, partial [Aeromonas jandaei]
MKSVRFAGQKTKQQQHRKRNITMSHTTNHPEYNYTVVRQFTVMTIVWGIVGMSVG